MARTRQHIRDNNDARGHPRPNPHAPPEQHECEKDPGGWKIRHQDHETNRRRLPQAIGSKVSMEAGITI